MSRGLRLLSLLAWAAGWDGFAGAAARAEVDPLAVKALPYLRAHATGMQVGETALLGTALLKADVAPNDPTITACLTKVLSRFGSSGYVPERSGGHDRYEAGVVAIFLSNQDAEANRARIQSVADYLMGKQNANGSWDYEQRQKGDSSITQYALLGLWEAENAGAIVSPSVWDRAAGFFLETQSPPGGWAYHRDEGSTDTISMTAAGVGSLLICQRQLALHKKGTDGPNALLTAVAAEGVAGAYKAVNAPARIEQAIKLGESWLGANFTLANNAAIIGQSACYALYGIERLGSLAGKDALGKVNWFEQGWNFLQATQTSGGSWPASGQGEALNTAWAVLFVTKATAKTLKRIEIKRLGAGTLLGGRGLPKDLSSMTVAGGRVVSRPMNGAVEGMLAVLEDPRALDTADAAASGLVTRYQVQGPAALLPFKDRFRTMLTDRDPGVRQVAAWCLARTGDLDVVPLLIGGLADPDEAVTVTARQGLQLLSRKVHGPGPPPGATLEQKREAQRQWRAWYDAVRPIDREGQDDESAVSRGPR